MGGTLAALRAGESADRAVMPTPTMRRDHDRAAGDDQSLRGHVDADGDQQVLQADRDAEAREDAEHRGDQADSECLDQHRAEYLAPPGPQRPEQTVLPRALSDRDRERIEYHEPADQHRDHGEDQQERVEEPQRLAQRALRLFGDRLPGDHFGACRECARHPLDEFCLGDAPGGDEVDGVVLAGFGDETLSYGRAERDDGRAAG